MENKWAGVRIGITLWSAASPLALAYCRLNYVKQNATLLLLPLEDTLETFMAFHSTLLGAHFSVCLITGQTGRPVALLLFCLQT